MLDAGHRIVQCIHHNHRLSNSVRVQRQSVAGVSRKAHWFMPGDRWNWYEKLI